MVETLPAAGLWSEDALHRVLRTAAALAFAGVMAATAYGCPKKDPRDAGSRLPAITSNDPEAESELRDADERYESGDPLGAESRYRAFLSARPKDPLAILAELGLGRVLLERGELTKAAAYFGNVAKHRDPATRDRGRLFEGVAWVRLGKVDAGAVRLREFVGRTVELSETVLALESLADAELALGEKSRAAVVLDTLIASPVGDDVRARTKRRGEALVVGATEDECLQMSDALPRQGYLWPLAAKRTIRIAYAQSEMARVRSLAAELRERDITVDDDLAAMALRAEQTKGVDSGAIGLVVPLSGRAQAVGEDVLRGALLGIGSDVDGPAPGGKPRIVFRDYGDDPTRAAGAVEDLVATHRVIAIIGPVAQEATAAAGLRSENLGVPMISLAPARGRNSPWVSFLLNPMESEAAALVHHAMAQGKRRFAIAGSSSAYGVAFRAAAEAQVRAQGGEVIATESYPAGTKNFAEISVALASLSFDSLLVADVATTMPLLAPSLAAAGLWPDGTDAVPEKARRVALLLPSAAHAPDLLRTTGRYLQGATLSAPFDPAHGGESARFAAAYRARYGSEPSLFSALGYDAARIVVGGIEGGAVDRAAAATAIRGQRIEPAGPAPGIDAAGQPLGAARLLVVRGASLAPVDR